MLNEIIVVYAITDDPTLLIAKNVPRAKAS
jgi:hypothetical protein